MPVSRKCASRMFARWPGEAIQAATIALGRAEPERAPADVLADFVADLRAVDVAGGAHAAERGFAARADVFEVVVEGHALGVALGGLLERAFGRSALSPWRSVRG